MHVKFVGSDPCNVSSIAPEMGKYFSSSLNRSSGGPAAGSARMPRRNASMASISREVHIGGDLWQRSRTARAMSSGMFTVSVIVTPQLQQRQRERTALPVSSMRGTRPSARDSSDSSWSSAATRVWPESRFNSAHRSRAVRRFTYCKLYTNAPVAKPRTDGSWETRDGRPAVLDRRPAPSGSGDLDQAAQKCFGEIFAHV